MLYGFKIIEKKTQTLSKRKGASSRLRKDNAAGNFVAQYYAQIVELSERHRWA